MRAARRRRLMMTTDCVGGVWTYSNTLVCALAAQRYEILLLVMGPAPPRHALEPLHGREGVTVSLTDFALEWMDPEGTDMGRTQVRLHDIARQFRPDIVHVNGFRDAGAEWGCPVLLVAHSCVRSWWQACRGTEPDEERWSHYAENVRRGLAAADQWIAPTRAFQRIVAELYAPPSPGSVIWNGIPDRPPERTKEAVVLAAGRLWDEAKNIDALAAIAGEIDWPIAVAGTAGQARGLTPPGRTLLCLGDLPRHDVLDLMERAGIYVAPARYEPFGLAILEAATAGCALVLSGIASLRELWDGAALFVDPDDRPGLRDAIRRLIADPVLRAALQQAARRRAERYSLAKMVHGYRAAYDRLLEDRPAAPSHCQLAGQAGP